MTHLTKGTQSSYAPERMPDFPSAAANEDIGTSADVPEGAELGTVFLAVDSMAFSSFPIKACPVST